MTKILVAIVAIFTIVVVFFPSSTVIKIGDNYADKVFYLKNFSWYPTAEATRATYDEKMRMLQAKVFSLLNGGRISIDHNEEGKIYHVGYHEWINARKKLMGFERYGPTTVSKPSVVVYFLVMFTFIAGGFLIANKRVPLWLMVVTLLIELMVLIAAMVFFYLALLEIGSFLPVFQYCYLLGICSASWLGVCFGIDLF